MGVCTSEIVHLTPEQKAHDKKLDEKLKEDNRKESLVHKLLLLGAGESGKSTLYKQMTTIYGNGFSEEDKKKFRPIVHSNTISAMQHLCRASGQLGKQGKMTGDKDLESCSVMDKKVIQCIKSILELRPLDDPLTEEICGKMKIIWKDPNILHTFKYHRGKFSLADSAEYFFGRLDETWKPEYIPDLQDVFRARVRTTGILEQRYLHNDSQFNLFDVGGQRNGQDKYT
eukprot:1390517-Amorphochlora_amoeboformis.AAC.3